ncbi:hypothetical protein [Rhodococcus phenolicus]|uniref:hypothetical protein n=1 Tax=Rhodococcus phenolicus TaxID=263849 RepID=UPI000837693A|nr:hypothetical protein [Rhodococcus phenolicus]
MTDIDRTEAQLRLHIGEAGAALLRLSESAPSAATALVALVQAVADEAARTPRFAKALTAAIAASGDLVAPTPPAPARAVAAKPAEKKAAARRGKRSPGPFDPFAVYRADGEDGLRARLAPLDLEQLKDIVAEHNMDYDRLAMRWRTASKLHDRIVERVKAAWTKGDAFR